MALESPLFQHHTMRAWSLDATTMGVEPEALDALPWATAFTAMEALEAGAIANPDEGREVGHYWLRAPDHAPTMGHAAAIGETANAIRAFAADVLAGTVAAEDGLPFRHVLHIGIGGSALGPQLVDAALAEGTGLPVHFIDNIDPDGIQRTLDAIGDALRHTLIVVVSKSGGTVETARATDLVQRVVEGQGLQWGPQCVAITGEGSKLDRRAVDEGWVARFPMWDWVGGRTSVTSAVGLLPAALAGIDTGELLRGAAEMDAWTRRDDWRTNPAALLAGCWHVTGGGHGDRNMVVLPYADRLLLFSRYLQQLVMESLGKRLDLEGREVEQGLSVFGNKGSTDQHAFVQQLRDGRRDFFVTFVQVLDDGRGDRTPVAGDATAGDVLQGFLLGTRRALADEDRPTMTLTLPRIDAAELGGLIALFERAVGLYASLVGINAYHQPGVEAGKKAAESVLRLHDRLRASLGRQPRTATELAREVQADALEVHYVLQRLAHDGRITVEGFGPDATYRKGVA